MGVRGRLALPRSQRAAGWVRGRREAIGGRPDGRGRRGAARGAVAAIGAVPAYPSNGRKPSQALPMRWSTARRCNEWTMAAACRPWRRLASRHRETRGLAGARSAIACPSSARRQPGRLPPQLWTPGGSREPRRGRLVPAPGRTGHGHGPPGATTKQPRRGREGQPRRGCEEQPRRGAREAAGGPQRRASAAAARPPRGPA
jgi:hypothetical protein